MKEFENDHLNQFYLEDDLCKSFDEYTEFGTIDEEELSEEQVRNNDIQDLLDFNGRKLFTPKP